MTFTFAVPTIMNNPEMEIRNVEKLAKNFPTSKVHFIANVEDEDFDTYKPKYPNIVKQISGVKYSISKALNLSIDRMEHTDYYVFVQSDVTFEPSVISIFSKLAESDPKCGIVGITKRSNFHKFNKKVNVVDNILSYKVLWTDGIMFMTSVIAKKFKFDESYFGDKESQDICYRLQEAGYNNYFIPKQENVSYAHSSVSFQGKVKTDKVEFLDTVDNTRKIFKSKWSIWEDSQKHLFV